MPSAAALTIEDKISDPLMPELDPDLLDFRPRDLDFNSKKDDPLNWNSQILTDPTSIEIGRHAPIRDQRNDFDEDEMHLELDLDIGDDGPAIDHTLKDPFLDRTADTLQNDTRYPEDVDLDTRSRATSRVPSLIEDDGRREPEDVNMMFDDDDFQLPLDDKIAEPQAFADPRLRRSSQSPLSSTRSSMAREFEATRLTENGDEGSIRQAPHKAKKRKVIGEDSDIILSSNQIRQQQADRSAILKPASLLSRDPLIYNLVNMEKNGGFVSNIMGDARAKGWAPELQGLLSFESVRKAGELKRKRDSGVADVSENEVQIGQIAPQLEIPDETFGLPDGVDEGFDMPDGDRAEIHLPADNRGLPSDEGDDIDDGRDRFDETTAPLLHPSEQGAISLGTKHAVHLLRDRFGTSADGTPAKSRSNQILFQDLLPEETTSKADATKMFFEVLVLATKDAVKVEQKDEQLGSDLRIRAKRGLWGTWAETGAGGEIAEQEDDDGVEGLPKR